MHKTSPRERAEGRRQHMRATATAREADRARGAGQGGRPEGADNKHFLPTPLRPAKFKGGKK